MRLALAALAATLAFDVADADPMHLRTCDGRIRHVTCHWSGGDPRSEWTVPPGESLGYGSPSVTLTDHGRITMIVGNCAISCDAPPAPDPAHPPARTRR